MSRFVALLPLLLLCAACIAPIQPVATPPDNRALASATIYQQLEAGETVKEVGNLVRQLPEGLLAEQLGGYFQLGTVDFALAMQPSLNVPLALPEASKVNFTGLLVSLDGKNWQKYLAIGDKDAIDKNNPYYLWSEAGDLFLSIVDQTGGGGSGEGLMKLERLADESRWELVGCYDFGQSYRGPTLDGDYFAFSQEIEQQHPRPLASCQSVELISNPRD